MIIGVSFTSVSRRKFPSDTGIDQSIIIMFIYDKIKLLSYYAYLVRARERIGNAFEIKTKRNVMGKKLLLFSNYFFLKLQEAKHRMSKNK